MNIMTQKAPNPNIEETEEIGGMLAGPVGEAKLTTIYASIHIFDIAYSDVCSVENPTERFLNGVVQIPIHTDEFGIDKN